MTTTRTSDRKGVLLRSSRLSPADGRSNGFRGGTKADLGDMCVEPHLRDCRETGRTVLEVDCEYQTSQPRARREQLIRAVGLDVQ